MTTNVQPSSVALTVENTGDKLDPQLVSTLVEPFQRGTQRIRTAYTLTKQESASAWRSSKASPRCKTARAYAAAAALLKVGDARPVAPETSQFGDLGARRSGSQLSPKVDALIAVTLSPSTLPYGAICRGLLTTADRSCGSGAGSPRVGTAPGRRRRFPKAVGSTVSTAQ